MFTPFRHDLKLKARNLRANLTPAEKKIWFHYLRNSNASVKFLRQKPIGNYIADFYCASKKLVVEIDGNSHFLSEDAMNKDKIREEFFRKNGLRILRFTNVEVNENFEYVCAEIEKWIKDN